ncbi:MAG: hypothetical protein JST87_17825 [Bacteroidetes bacterium]|nr:hypothetical protein [Bacteroidota bacterium]
MITNKKPQLLFCTCLFFASLANAQTFLRKIEKQRTIGAANGSLNFQGSISSGLGYGFGFNLFSINSASVCVGTNLKLGFENRYGLGYLAFLADYLSPGTIEESNNLADYAEFPAYIHFNYGYGSSHKSTKRFGFYFGAGASYLITGYAHDSTNSYPASFWGISADAGIRFDHFELGFSRIFSIGGALPGLPQPAFYQVTLYSFIGSWEKW